MKSGVITKILVANLLLACCASTSIAQESQWEVGLRGNVMLGDGLPANDMLGFGVISRYYLNDGWFAGAALDTTDFDFGNSTGPVSQGDRRRRDQHDIQCIYGSPVW